MSENHFDIFANEKTSCFKKKIFCSIIRDIKQQADPLQNNTVMN